MPPKPKTSKKSQLGQFYTTNYAYILQHMSIPSTIQTVIEPFTGNGDLLQFIHPHHSVECYDIDPKTERTVKRDTLRNPPNYNDKFVLTNPPYLARNKNQDKDLYDRYECNDLYKCFIINLIESERCMGGILIIPLNFICSIRKADIDLRRKFLSKYGISCLNIFEEQVFDDTSYAVCSFQFYQRTPALQGQDNIIHTHIFPEQKTFHFCLNEANHFTIGGEIYQLTPSSFYKVERTTSKNMDLPYSNILLKCIDDCIHSKIRLMMTNEPEQWIDKTPNLTGRSYALLTFQPPLNGTQQNALVNAFNTYLEIQRTTYNSLFLTNFRESNTIARKRISFELAFTICSYLLDTLRV